MNKTTYNKITSELFSIPRTNVYAVIDGASVKGLLEKFIELEPDHECLYRGELSPQLRQASPYVVQLQKAHPFTRWVIEEGWGKHWGIFAISGADLGTMLDHFHPLLSVMSHEGKKLYFRYYDPRVLQIFLPTCNHIELDQLFGPVSTFMLENAKESCLTRFQHDSSKARSGKKNEHKAKPKPPEQAPFDCKAELLYQAAENGTPFCEKYEKAKAEQDKKEQDKHLT